MHGDAHRGGHQGPWDIKDNEGIAHTTTTAALTEREMAEVTKEQGEAFYRACCAGNVVEVTRTLGCYDVASLVNWRDPVFGVRPVLREEEACGSPLNVTRDGVSSMVDVSLTRPYVCMCGFIMIV